MEINDIRAHIYARKENIVNDLIRLVRIPSVSTPSDDAEYPFGRECARALDAYSSIAREHGLAVRNFDNACVGAAMRADVSAENAVGIWCHVDVVPVSDGWTYPPFEGVYTDNLVIGRGAQDNKCAAAAGVYILEYLKSVNLCGNYIWFAGCSEECGMQDIDRYLKSFPAPRLNLIADCGFPVCIGEKTVAPKDTDDPIVKCLCGVYNSITGENSEPYTIGGSTYASKLPNAYPYGIILGDKQRIREHFPDGHGDYHEPDETVEIDKLLEAMVIYIMSIIELDKFLYE